MGVRGGGGGGGFHYSVTPVLCDKVDPIDFKLHMALCGCHANMFSHNRQRVRQTRSS